MSEIRDQKNQLTTKSTKNIKMQEKIKYRDIRDELDTGDVLLFRGKGLLSAAILWFCSIVRLRRTEYSHIGVILKFTQAEIEYLVLLFREVASQVPVDLAVALKTRAVSGKEFHLFCMESTSLGKGKAGVRLSELSKVLKSYDGTVRVRKLRWYKSEMRIVRAMRFVVENVGINYPSGLAGVLVLAAAAVDPKKIDFPIKQKNTRFCSDLVTGFFRILVGDVFGVPDYEVIPENFAKGDFVDKQMRLCTPSASLGEEIELEL